MMRAVSRFTLAALLVLAAVAMVAQVGSVPHTHVGVDGGLFNEEHDLTLLAGLAGHGLPADGGPILTLDSVSAPLQPFVPECPILRVTRSGDSRAPPSA